jgi:hypothetical protein
MHTSCLKHTTLCPRRKLDFCPGSAGAKSYVLGLSVVHNLLCIAVLPPATMHKSHTTIMNPIETVILVVEDDPDIADLLATVLNENGYQVLVASTADQAMIYLAEARTQHSSWTAAVSSARVQPVAFHVLCWESCKDPLLVRLRQRGLRRKGITGSTWHCR